MRAEAIQRKIEENRQAVLALIENETGVPAGMYAYADTPEKAWTIAVRAMKEKYEKALFDQAADIQSHIQGR